MQQILEINYPLEKGLPNGQQSLEQTSQEKEQNSTKQIKQNLDNSSKGIFSLIEECGSNALRALDETECTDSSDQNEDQIKNQLDCQVIRDEGKSRNQHRIECRHGNLNRKQWQLLGAAWASFLFIMILSCQL